MASEVDRAIAEGRHLVVQAGTGTGKSLAYLIPAALSDQPIVVATATKALQDQLATNDLPLVAGAIGRHLSYAVLKGRSNYLCRQRVAEVDGGGEQLSLAPDGAEPPDADDRFARDAGDGAGDGGRLRGPGQAADPLGGGDRHRRSGRARVRAALPGLGHGLHHRRRVPGRLPLPFGRRLFRRGRPGPRRRRRRGGGQHPSLRGPPGQRGRGAPAPPGGRLRRGPPARRGDDRQSRGGDRPGPVQSLGRLGPTGPRRRLAGRRRRRRRRRRTGGPLPTGPRPRSPGHESPIVAPSTPPRPRDPNAARRSGPGPRRWRWPPGGSAGSPTPSAAPSGRATTSPGSCPPVATGCCWPPATWPPTWAG